MREGKLGIVKSGFKKINPTWDSLIISSYSDLGNSFISRALFTPWVCIQWLKLMYSVPSPTIRKKTSLMDLQYAIFAFKKSMPWGTPKFPPKINIILSIGIWYLEYKLLSTFVVLFLTSIEFGLTSSLFVSSSGLCLRR